MVFGLCVLAMPEDDIISKIDQEIDWAGYYLGIGGLVLFSFVWK